MTVVETPVKEPAREAGQDFIRDIVRADLEAGRRNSVVTRFPPEPNGYLHIGHAKSICLNFGIADEFGGHCNLRYDDTNPTKESQEYIDAIERDVRWLGFDWGTHLYHASDYFERLYGWAEDLIGAGKAYVDDQSQDEMRAARGTLTEPGKNSPFRDRGVEENLDLFRRMRTGEFPNGARVLRAKIDMAAGNINLRDPVLYRILHAEHPRTGKTWSIYPSYDFAHGQSDAIEGITHSLCTLEFEDHRPLYDWFLQNLPVPSQPHQYEFARLNLTYTILSKRVLTELVRGGHVHGWDDPRMPTLAGLRRRGVPPEAIRDFVKRIGVAKANSTVDMAMLDFSIREHLNGTAQRRMAVLRPLKVVIENYPEGQSEEVEAVNHPEDATAGTRRVRFGRELFIERDDFMENPPKKFFRLSPGTEVRLRYAYFITCREVVKNAAGEVIELKCTYDPATKGGNAPDGRKVKATMHWVSAADSVPAEVRLYNPLFTKPDPSATDFAAEINPNSLDVIADARVEPALAGRNANDAVQFERLGYFCPDKDSTPERLVFNRTVGLRDTWAKVSGGAAAERKADLAATAPGSFSVRPAMHHKAKKYGRLSNVNSLHGCDSGHVPHRPIRLCPPERSPSSLSSSPAPSAGAAVAVAQKSPEPARAAPAAPNAALTTPIEFYVAHGDANACGPGCSEWIAAEGKIDVGAADRFRQLLRKLGTAGRPSTFIRRAEK